MSTALLEMGLEREEIDILSPSSIEPIEQWCETHRIVPNKPYDGPWSNDTFPILTPIMTMIFAAIFAVVVIVASPQKGKTEGGIINPLLYALFALHLDAMYMNTSLNNADGIWHKKIKPAILASFPEAFGLPREQLGRRQLRHFANSAGASLFVNGAESAGNLAADSIPVVLCDDVDDYPTDLDGKGHPCDLAFKRADAYAREDRILVEAGTISTRQRRAWKRFEQGTQFRPYVPCPACGTWQLIDHQRMVFDPASVHRTRKNTWMRCLNDDCAYKIRDRHVGPMLARHVWVGRDQRIEGNAIIGKLPVSSDDGASEWSVEIIPGVTRFGLHHPESSICSFWYNAFYWPEASWGDLMERWITSRGDPDAEKEWQIHVAVEPWEDPDADFDRITEQELAEHVVDFYALGTVPDGVDVITLAADVGDYAIHWSAQGWSRDGRTWLIDFGKIKVAQPRGRKNMAPEEADAWSEAAIPKALDALWKIEDEGWKTSGGTRMNARLCGVDMGWRPDTIGGWVARRRSRKWVSVRGSKLDDAPMAPRRITRTQRTYPRLELGVYQGKLLLRDRLRIPRGGHGYWNFGAGKKLDTYFKHLASEELVTETDRLGNNKRVWKKTGGANHWWDCAVYSLCLGLVCGVCLLGEEAKPHSTKKPTRRSLQTADGRPYLVTER